MSTNIARTLSDEAPRLQEEPLCFPIDPDDECFLLLEEPGCVIRLSHLGWDCAIGFLEKGSIDEQMILRGGVFVSRHGAAVHVPLNASYALRSGRAHLTYPAISHELFQSICAGLGLLRSQRRQIESDPQRRFILRPPEIRAELEQAKLLEVPLKSSGRGQTTWRKILSIDQDLVVLDGPPITSTNEELVFHAVSHGRQWSTAFRLNEESKRPNQLRLPRFISYRAGRALHRETPTESVVVSFIHPVWGIAGKAALLDISAQGVALLVEQSELFPVGLRLPLEFRGPNIPLCRTIGIVRRNTASTVSGKHQLGLNIETGTGASLASWVELFQTLIFADSRTVRPNDGSIYQRAGYLSLSGKSAKDFNASVRDFSICTEKLAEAPELACLRVWPATGQAQATIAHARVYGRTWFLYQVAKVPNVAVQEGRRGLYRLYVQAYEHAMTCNNGDWFWSFVQETAAPWSRHFHREIPELWRDADAFIYRFEAIEVTVGGFPGAAPQPLTVEEYQLLATRLSVELSDTYLQALDLRNVEKDFSTVSEAWRVRGMERQRAVFVVRRDDLMIAAVVVESSPQGLHLYGLLDCARIFALTAMNMDEVNHALQMARRWFSQRNRLKFVWHLEEMQWPRVSEGSKLLPGNSSLGIAHGSILPLRRISSLLDLLHRRIGELSNDEVRFMPEGSRRTSAEASPHGDIHAALD